MKVSHITSTLTLALAVIAIAGCNDKPKQVESTQSEIVATTNVTEPSTNSQQVPVGDTPENSLDWHGEYEGILPCADCEGIKTELELKQDKTFELKQTYLGKGNQSSESKGSFTFSEKNPSIVILSIVGDEAKPQFFIGEGYAEARALDGSEIISDLKAHYRLTKQADEID